MIVNKRVRTLTEIQKLFRDPKLTLYLSPVGMYSCFGYRNGICCLWLTGEKWMISGLGGAYSLEEAIEMHAREMKIQNNDQKQGTENSRSHGQQNCSAKKLLQIY